MIKVIEEIYEWLHIAGFQFGDKSKLELGISLVNEEVQEMKDALTNNDAEELKDAFGDIIFVIANVCYFYGIKSEDLATKFDQIVKSNYSKFCQTREQAILSAEAYIKGTHFTKPGQRIPAKTEYTGNNHFPYVVKHLKTGKLLKGLGFKHPNEF